VRGGPLQGSGQPARRAAIPIGSRRFFAENGCVKLLPALCLLLLATGCARQAPDIAAEPDSGPPGTAPAPVASDTFRLAALPAGTRLVTVEVGGMVCDGCIELVGRELKSVAGVRSVHGNLMEQRFDVACDPGVHDSSLTTAVRRAGPQYLGMIAHP